MKWNWLPKEEVEKLHDYEIVVGYVYCIWNKANNKKYVGQTENIINRRYSHLSRLRKGNHNNIALQNDFNLYGESAFEFLILEFINADFNYGTRLHRNIRDAEKDWMLALGTFDESKGYNCNDIYFKHCNRFTKEISVNKGALNISSFRRIPLECLALEGGE